MKHKPINLLFDYGGVLVDLDKQRCIRAFAALGFDIRPYLGTYAQAGFFSELERGAITEKTFCNKIRQAAANDALTDEQICNAWKDYLTGVPEERLQLLLKIRRHYPVYLLSNTNAIHWRMAEQEYFNWQGHAVGDFFLKEFLSFEIGAEKPSPAIYQAVIDGIGCEAADILFFDDSEVNCEAARQMGMQARLAPANSGWLDFFTPDGEYIASQSSSKA